jgi:hypothetical protein
MTQFSEHVIEQGWVNYKSYYYTVHFYLTLYEKPDDKIMYLVVNQFLSADVKL